LAFPIYLFFIHFAAFPFPIQPLATTPPTSLVTHYPSAALPVGVLPPSAILTHYPVSAVPGNGFPPTSMMSYYPGPTGPSGVLSPSSYHSVGPGGQLLNSSMNNSHTASLQQPSNPSAALPDAPGSGAPTNAPLPGDKYAALAELDGVLGSAGSGTGTSIDWENRFPRSSCRSSWSGNDSGSMTDGNFNVGNVTANGVYGGRLSFSGGNNAGGTFNGGMGCNGNAGHRGSIVGSNGLPSPGIMDPSLVGSG